MGKSVYMYVTKGGLQEIFINMKQNICEHIDLATLTIWVCVFHF